MRAYLNSFLLTTALCIGLLFTGCQEEEKPARVIETSTVTDVDGNVYKTVKIGNQWWMAENLRVTRFVNGEVLQVIDENVLDTVWAGLSEPAFTSINGAEYGLLYNYAVVESLNSIAPVGWHVPSDEEWKTLEKEVGMSSDETLSLGWRGSIEAAKLTSLYSAGWPEGASLFGTDEFGFNAKPGGCKVFNGQTNLEGSMSFWWTASASGNEGWYRYIDASQTRIFRQHTYKGYGMSIRCVKNS
jgi:uncharacterized protein (TIGR02145 family)